MSENYQHLRMQDEMEGVVRVTLCRGSKMNALDLEVMDELCNAFEGLEKRTQVRVVIFDSEGERAFVAGADIAQMAGMNPLEFRQYSLYLRRLAKVMTSSEKIYVGAVQGVAFGGGNILAMNCDVVFATPKSRFGQQEIEFGILGGLPRLIYLVGARRAWDIAITGKAISAPEAEQIGLITKCVPEEEFAEYVTNYVKIIMQKAETAVRLCKALKKFSENAGLDASYEYENELISLCFASDDTKRLMTDFVKKSAR